jgi:predicted nucleic acid-binding protein
MKESRKPISLLLDNNVFVAAVKNPDKTSKSLQLILQIIKDSDIQLVGNMFLLEEMAKYAEVFKSPTAALILEAMVSKMDVNEVKESYIKLVKGYFTAKELVDAVHAATCLQADAILVTNDKHFNKMKEAEVITIWSISEALKKLGK